MTFEITIFNELHSLIKYKKYLKEKKNLTTGQESLIAVENEFCGSEIRSKICKY